MLKTYMPGRSNGNGNGVSPIASRIQANKTAPLGTGRGNVSAQSQLSFTLDNSMGMATALYIIGDATGQVADLDGRAFVDPDATSTGVTVALQKAGFQVRPLLINEVNLETSSDPAQFAQGLQVLYMEQLGDYSRRQLIIGGFASPSDFNNLIRPVNLSQLDNPVMFSDYAALVVPVIAGEIVTVYANVAENVAGRS